VAIFRDLERSDQDEVFRAALSVGIVLLLIGSLLAWRLADRVLAPVRQTAATARSISETDLSRRVAVQGDDEVAELARTFNEMLDRVGSAFQAQQRFMDDVGHELRTPLTIVQGHLELLDEGSPPERERAVELMLEEVERMTGLVSDLMLLAASAQPDFIKRERVDVAELARSVLDKARVLGDRDWQLDLVRPGTILADRQRLTQAMLQLVANAVRLTGPGGAIHIGADVHDSVARLWVSDTGPGIPEAAQDDIFRRPVQHRIEATHDRGVLEPRQASASRRSPRCARSSSSSVGRRILATTSACSRSSQARYASERLPLPRS